MGCCVAPPCLVSEYCAHGSLHDVLKEARCSPELAGELTWDRRLAWALGAASAMSYLVRPAPLYSCAPGPEIPSGPPCTCVCA